VRYFYTEMQSTANMILGGRAMGLSKLMEETKLDRNRLAWLVDESAVLHRLFVSGQSATTWYCDWHDADGYIVDVDNSPVSMTMHVYSQVCEGGDTIDWTGIVQRTEAGKMHSLLEMVLCACLALAIEVFGETPARGGPKTLVDEECLVFGTLIADVAKSVGDGYLVAAAQRLSFEEGEKQLLELDLGRNPTSAEIHLTQLGVSAVREAQVETLFLRRKFQVPHVLPEQLFEFCEGKQVKWEVYGDDHIISAVGSESSKGTSDDLVGPGEGYVVSDVILQSSPNIFSVESQAMSSSQQVQLEEKDLIEEIRRRARETVAALLRGEIDKAAREGLWNPAQEDYAAKRPEPFTRDQLATIDDVLRQSAEKQIREKILILRKGNPNYISWEEAPTNGTGPVVPIEEVGDSYGLMELNGRSNFYNFLSDEGYSAEEQCPEPPKKNRRRRNRAKNGLKGRAPERHRRCTKEVLVRRLVFSGEVLVAPCGNTVACLDVTSVERAADFRVFGLDATVSRMDYMSDDPLYVNVVSVQMRSTFVNRQEQCIEASIERVDEMESHDYRCMSPKADYVIIPSDVAGSVALDTSAEELSRNEQCLIRVALRHVVSGNKMNVTVVVHIVVDQTIERVYAAV